MAEVVGTITGANVNAMDILGCRQLRIPFTSITDGDTHTFGGADQGITKVSFDATDSNDFVAVTFTSPRTVNFGTDGVTTHAGDLNVWFGHLGRGVDH